jgi:hypothetical protein
LTLSLRFAGLTGILAAGLALLVAGPSSAQHLRPPAVPLVTFNPYLSIWSEADKLTDDVTRHWTHHEHALNGLIRIDGKTYRLMGIEPADTPAFPETGCTVLPTRTICEFDDAHVHVTLTFMTAALPTDLDVYARPLSYLTWNVKSVDGKQHAVSVYQSVSSQLAVNTPEEKVVWARGSAGSLDTLRAGTPDQNYLGIAGDDARLDWGYAYLAAPSLAVKSCIGGDTELLKAFVNDGSLPERDDPVIPRPANEDTPTLAIVFDLGSVGQAVQSRHAMVAYDEVYAISYFGKRLRPYWRRRGNDAIAMLVEAEHDYEDLVTRCTKFDESLMADMTRVGGAEYAQVAALSYRQALAATGLAADSNGQPLLFTKENTSNGDIATVDVIFPMEPVFLLLSPTLAKASLVPILSYAASSHWKFPNAPHDLGTYPVARGTDDGGEGMPVEESGNMILLCDAIAQEEHSPAFVAPWWNKITQWAQYLLKYGQDPEDQLCTDDFMGHLAHNANLSVKAILALAAFGDLCRMRGDAKTADRYHTLAVGFARHWMQAADDGGHYRLAFDKPNTWSQKYNLAWDRILNLNGFPPSVAASETAYYKQVMQPYGVPLDSRTHLTKTDWSVWSATLAANQADFEAIISPIYRYLNTTTNRQPLVDSYITDNVKSDGMHARSVVGGIFIKMLTDPAVWSKWAGQDQTRVGHWAPLPPPPVITPVIPTSQRQAQIWHYTTTKPSDGWVVPGFNDSGWKTGPGGFGTAGTPGIVVGTTWNTDDIWIRRTITMPAEPHPHLKLIVFHDEDIEIYVNGVLAASAPGYNTAYEPFTIRPLARALLVPGATVTISAHCHQTTGGQGIDIGLSDVTEVE